MIDDLLFLSKNLLLQIDRFDFSEDERDYIINVVRKVAFILLIELRKNNGGKV